jgi:Zn-dependent membrane protease YugP
MEVDIMAPEVGQVVGQRSSVVVLLVTEDKGPVLVRASLWTSVLMMAGAFILLRYLMKLGIIRLLVVAMLLKVVSSFPWVIIRLLLNLLGP